MQALARGDLLPEILTALPGPASRALARDLARHEAPGINTLGGDGEPAMVWRAARGANVLDVDGNRFLDFTSGFGAATIGHRHPRVVAARRAPGGRAPARPRRRRRAPGADRARRAALRTRAGRFAARPLRGLRRRRRRDRLEDRPPRDRQAASSRFRSRLPRPDLRRPRRDLAARVPRPVPAPSSRRTSTGCRSPARSTAWRSSSLAGSRAEPASRRSSSNRSSAARASSCRPPGWLAGLARLCREAGAVLILDEILTGFAPHRPHVRLRSRSGAPRSPVLRQGARRRPADRRGGRQSRPDERLAHRRRGAAHRHVRRPSARLRRGARDPGRHRGGGSRRARRRRSARAIAAALAPAAPRRHPCCAGAAPSGASSSPDAGAAASLVDRLRQRGLLLLRGGPSGRVVELLPPLVISDDQLDFALAALLRGARQPAPMTGTS